MLLIFLPAILISACASSSPAFRMMYSAYKLNKQGDNTQPCCAPNLEPVRRSMSGFSCCSLTCIQVSQEAGKVVWYSHLLKTFFVFLRICCLRGAGKPSAHGPHIRDSCRAPGLCQGLPSKTSFTGLPSEGEERGPEEGWGPAHEQPCCVPSPTLTLRCSWEGSQHREASSPSVTT